MTTDPNLGAWGEYDAEAAEADVEGMKGESLPWWKAPEGKSVIRVMPPPAGVRSPIVIRAMHRLEDPTDSDNWAQHLCRKKMLQDSKEPCATCEREQQYKQSEDPVEADMAKEMWAKTTALVNIVDITNEGTRAKGCQIWQISKGAIDELKLMRDTYGDYSHPISGYGIIIVRTGQLKKTKYKYIGDSKNPTPLAVQCPGITASSLVDFKPLLLVPSYLQTKQIVGKVLDGESADDDRPAKQFRAPPARVAQSLPLPGRTIVQGQNIGSIDLGNGDLDLS